MYIKVSGIDDPGFLPTFSYLAKGVRTSNIIDDEQVDQLIKHTILDKKGEFHIVVDQWVIREEAERANATTFLVQSDGDEE